MKNLPKNKRIKNCKKKRNSFNSPTFDPKIKSPISNFKTQTSTTTANSPRISPLPINFIENLKSISQQIVQKGNYYWSLFTEENTGDRKSVV